MRLPKKKARGSRPRPRTPAALTVPALRQWGFEGGFCIRDLQRMCCQPRAAGFPIPRAPGVYIVIRQSRSSVRFLPKSCGGRFRRRNPALPIAKLRTRWVARTMILYIGKAGGGAQRSTLHSRLLSYMRFGLGKPTAHWGGRCIWQLADASRLRVYWKTSRGPLPRAIEKQLLATFVRHHGQLPFANLTG